MGSTQVVSVLKHYLHPNKIGHAGTLDPLATGVLPIALGKATRLIPYVMAGKKTYQFQVKWGVETDSDDLAGQEVSTSDKIPTEREIRSVLPKFVGEIMQTPNVFSALRINGKRAYDLAREGKKVKIEPRPITIYDLKILDIQADNTTFEVVCSKGTYVRSLAHDIAHALATVGVVTMLRRIACLPFDLNEAIALDDIKAGKITEQNLNLIPMEGVIQHLPVLTFSATEVKRLSQGQRLSWLKLEISQPDVPDGVYCVQTDAKIQGLVTKKGRVVSPEFIW